MKRIVPQSTLVVVVWLSALAHAGPALAAACRVHPISFTGSTQIVTDPGGPQGIAAGGYAAGGLVDLATGDFGPGFRGFGRLPNGGPPHYLFGAGLNDPVAGIPGAANLWALGAGFFTSALGGGDLPGVAMTDDTGNVWFGWGIAPGGQFLNSANIATGKAVALAVGDFNNPSRWLVRRCRGHGQRCQ